MSTRICIIRHGETDWNQEGRIQGQIDISLNDTGKAQALAMAFNAAHHRFSAIYSSDLKRTMETARALAEREGHEVIPMEGLRERHYGIFQNVTKHEAGDLYPEAHALYINRDLNYNFETGESLLGFADRVMNTFDWLARHHQNELIAVATHAGVLDVIRRIATEKPLQEPRDFHIPNCALNWFHHDGKGWHLEAWDDHHYLANVILDSVE